MSVVMSTMMKRKKSGECLPMNNLRSPDFFSGAISYEINVFVVEVKPTYRRCFTANFLLMSVNTTMPIQKFNFLLPITRCYTFPALMFNINAETLLLPAATVKLNRKLSFVSTEVTAKSF